MGKAHESSYNSYPNICSDIEVYRFGGTLQVEPKAHTTGASKSYSLFGNARERYPK